MNIVVCIKQVPASTHVKMDPVKHTLIRDKAGATINPYDLHALEAALQIRENYGGIVTAVTMGPFQASDVLKKAVGMTVDDAVLVCGREFAGADTLATSYTLSSAIKKVCPADLIICGKIAVDGDTAQVGPGMSKWLGMSLVCNVISIEKIEDKKIFVKRAVEGGTELVSVTLPAVITVDKSINIPRIESIKGRFRELEFEPKVVNAEEIDCDLTKIGLNGSPTSVAKVFVPERQKAEHELIEGKNVSEKAQKVADFLFESKLII